MAVLDSNQTVSNNRNGFDKEISKSARTMMLDNIQNFIYQKPIPSCVRETVSNCIDATNEKLVALKIINGEIDVKDVYKTLDDVQVAKDQDNIYEDSEFKRDYYDPKWLSSSNKITIRYKTNPVAGERDMFSITDNGVGIGDARLEGIFSLGFSTKRLNTNELGGFGIGQKSALATGVASYRMTTRHNGKEFTYDIFSHKVENVNGVWNTDGSKNLYVEFHNTWVDTGRTTTSVDEEGNLVEKPIMEKFKSYYLPTKQKNGTTIEFEVKPHNKPQFIDAVKSQLMYLQDDIDFEVIDAYGNKQLIPFKASPIYEDENIILSNYGFYNRPHFVIKGIAYGMIDFAEAELSPKFGNMGFKFKMEDLDVLPSREGVRYTPKTTAAILSVYDKNKATVTKMLQEELSETKLFPWLKSANKITNRAGNGNSQDVISRLSSLSDQSELDLQFNENIKYSSSFKTLASPLLGLQVLSMGYSHNLDRKESDFTLSIDNSTHFQFETASNRKTGYLLVSHPSITVIRTNINYRYLAPIFKMFVDKSTTEEQFIEDANNTIDANEVDNEKRKNIKEYLKQALNFVKELRDDVPSYDTLEVPADFTLKEDIAESEIAQEIEADKRKKILAERKANKEFYVQEFEIKSTWNNSTKLARRLVKFSELDKKATDDVELVYFTEDSNAEIVKFVSNVQMTRANKPFDNDKLYLFKIAKSNVNQVKLISKPIEEWFYNIDDNGVMKLAPIVGDLINSKQKFHLPSWTANGGSNINEGFFERVKKLDALTKDSVKLDTPVKIIEAIETLNLLAIEYENDYEAEVLDKAIAKFNADYKPPTDVTKIECINPEIIQLTKECKDFESVYGHFLRNVHVNKVKDEVEIILQAKKDQLQYKFKGLHDEFNS
jgi:hypothetical protein